jgi:hypothetical protein
VLMLIPNNCCGYAIIGIGVSAHHSSDIDLDILAVVS